MCLTLKISYKKHRSFLFSNQIFFILLLNPILSLALDSTNFHFFYIEGPLLAGLLLFELSKKRSFFTGAVIVLSFTGISVLLALLMGSAPGKLNNHLFNYLNTIFLMLFTCVDDNMVRITRYVRKHIKALVFIVILVNFVELIMLSTHRGYVDIYSWRGTFFQGTNSMPHTLSYLMLVVILLNICVIIFTRKKWFSLFSILPTYCIFISGARVSLLLCAILICVILSYVFTEKQKKIIVKFIKILPLVLMFLFAFKNEILESDAMNKILARFESGNISAGRAYMLIDLWNHFIHDSNPLQYFFGQGDDKTYYYNSINVLVGTEVWAHNDVMQILVGKGLLGIIVYFTTVFLFFYKMIKKNGNIYSIAFITFIIIAALFNGFYSYRDIALSIPFIMIINNELSYKHRKNSR